MQFWRRFRYGFVESVRETYGIAKREGLLKFAWIILAVFFLTAVFAFVFEYQHNPNHFENFWDAIWFSIVTGATVGYGDKFPITLGGKVITLICILLFMLFIMPLYWATITSVYVSKRIKEGKGLEEVKFIDHLVICGWNENAESILVWLRKLRNSELIPVILVADLDEDFASELIYRYEDMNLKFVHGDYAADSVLKRANIQYAKYAIILADYSSQAGTKSDERAVLATLAIKGSNHQVRVVVELINSESLGHVKRAAADEIIVVGEHSGYLLTAAVLSPGIPEVMRTITNSALNVIMWQRKIPKELIGKTFKELSENFLETKNEILIGIVSLERTIALDDVLGDDMSSIDAFIKQQFAKAGKKELTHGAENVEVNVNPGASYEIRDNDIAVVIGAGGGR